MKDPGETSGCLVRIILAAGQSKRMGQAKALLPFGRQNVLERVVEAGRSVTFDALYDRVLEDIAREHHHRLHDDPQAIDMDDFRATVAARTRRFLDDR